MATLKETIAQRKRAKEGESGTLRGMVLDLMPGILEELLAKMRPDVVKELTPAVESAVLKNADRLKVKGDKGDKGDEGNPGDDAPAVDEEKIVKKVRALIPDPEDGEDADEDAVVEKVLEKIPPPVEPLPVDHEKIARTVLGSIKKEKLIKPEHIDGLQEVLKNWQKNVQRGAKSGLMRGGGDIVLAGAGISLARDSVGRTTITNLNTSGFTALDATETPNGSLLVFTFAAATAQPSYIISDNVWMKAIAKSGTINWVWNNGTKKATMAVPPTDDIEAIV